MTNKLEEFLKEKKRGLFMAHMIAGFPTMAESEKVAQALVEGGADIIELQIPFSDPMADGPTIATACEEALKNGATVAGALGLAKKVSAMGKPVAIMSYVNPIYRFGIAEFLKTISSAGITALIVPDCPFDTEEGAELLKASKETGVCLIPVVSPGVPKERLEQLAKDSCGFVYCTTRQGITGATGKFSQELADFVKELKSIFNLPVAVGFGVKSKEDVQQLSQYADIVIAGSVFVDGIKTKGNVKNIIGDLRN